MIEMLNILCYRHHGSSKTNCCVRGLENDWMHSQAESSDNPSLHVIESGGTHDNCSAAAYFLWPPNSQLFGSAHERAAYFNGLHKSADAMYSAEVKPTGEQASTLLDLMTIRAFHSKALRRCSLGTALGFRTRHGVITSIPAIIVFVARKVQSQWLHDMQMLPAYVEVLYIVLEMVRNNHFGHIFLVYLSSLTFPGSIIKR